VKDDPSVPLTDLPSSLYRADKPDFFGDRTWPWVEPAGDKKEFSLPAKERFDAANKK
jgi:hypothetical protein